MALFSGNRDVVTPVYIKADGVNFFQSVVRITFGVSNLMVNGNLIQDGSDYVNNVVVVYPTGETPLALSAPGEVSTAFIDVPPGDYPDGTISVRVRDNSLDPPYLEGQVSLGPISVFPPLTATIVPYPLDDGRYLLMIANVTYDGDPVEQGTVTVEEQKISPISINLSQGSGNIYGPYHLDVNSFYDLKYSTSKISFNTLETFQGALVPTTVTDSGATLTLTYPVDNQLFSISDVAVSSNSQTYEFKLYRSGVLVQTVPWNGTNVITFTASGLSSETEYTYTLKYADTITVSSSKSSETYNILSRSGLNVTFTTGGSSGGGGGNNGGNGHNNMATLEFSYDGYTGDVTQTNTITVLGEEGGALPSAYDTLEVHVTPAELSQALAYKGTWTTEGEVAGEQPHPDVKFLPALACGTRLESMYAFLKTKGTGAEDADGRKWKDSNGDKKERFGNIMLGVSFANSWLDDNELPREAIRKIEEGDLVTPDHFATADDDSVVKDLTSTATGAPKALLEGLFEQAVAAGKILGSGTAGANDGAPEHTLLGNGWKQAVFAEDDSISFLVKFSFEKTRDYVIDSLLTSGNSKPTSKSITVNGTTYEIVATDETSTKEEKLYIVKMVAKVSPVDPAAAS